MHVCVDRWIDGSMDPSMHGWIWIWTDAGWLRRPQSQLAIRTGGVLSNADYTMVVQAAGCDPASGLSEAGLLRVYTDLKLGNVDTDYKALGLGS